jgi:CHAD domain-containing protein
LKLAAQLHADALPHSRKNPMRAALEWVRSKVEEQLPEQDQYALAAVLAFHQGKLKRKGISRLDLSPKQVRQVLTIAALLRIAEGLSHSGDGRTIIQKVEPRDGGLWIVVDGPNAAADALAAQQSARLWVKIGYPEVEILESKEAAIRLLPFPEPRDEVGMQAKDAIAEAGRKVMLFHFARLLSHETGTRQGEDIEALHDMRVATRRLRAALQVFEEAFEPGALKPFRRGLQAVGRALGAVRDLDVFMEKAQQYVQALPEERRDGLNPLLDHWKAEREAARAEMLKVLDSEAYAEFKRKFNIFLHTPGAGARPIPAGQPSPQTVAEIAPVLIYSRLAEARAFAPFLKEAPIELLHMLRIEFKKLRYTVEYFEEVLGKQARYVINELKLLQDHLGDLNDAQVATQILRQFIDEWESQQVALPIHERQNIEEVVNYLAFRHAERHRLMAAFQDVWRQHFGRAGFRRALAQAVSVL